MRQLPHSRCGCIQPQPGAGNGIPAMECVAEPAHSHAVILSACAAAVGRAAPAVEGGEGLSTADLQGKVAIVNFHASWCAPCRAEHPILMQLEKRTGVPVYGIAWKDKPADLRAWLAADGNPFSRAGFDGNGRVGIDWGISGVPETFIVDRSGKVVWRFQGALNEPMVAKSLIPVLQGLK